MRDASELFMAMDGAIERERHGRRSSSPNSPQQADTIEAEPGCTFTMIAGGPNVPTQRPLSMKWAVAHTLHFFTGSEDAQSLGRYNRLAEKFAPGGKWVGAYGAIACPQLVDVVSELKMHSESRRAFVSMGQMHPMDLNRPACWNHLQFLKFRNKLDMLVEQRSLMLHGVMAYDCVLLTNIQLVVANLLDLQPGCLRWRIGSLHKLTTHPKIDCWTPPRTLHFPRSVVTNPLTCETWLNEPTTADGFWADYLQGAE